MAALKGTEKEEFCGMIEKGNVERCLVCLKTVRRRVTGHVLIN